MTARDAMPAAQADALLAPLLDLESDAVWIVDVATLGYAALNRAACEMLGLPRDVLLADGAGASAARSGMHPETLREHYADLVRQAPAPFRYSTSYVRPGGTSIEVDIVRQAVRMEGRWFVIVRATPLSEDPQPGGSSDLRRFSDLARGSQNAIALVDHQTMRYLEVNEPLCRMLGRTREEMMAARPAQVAGLPEDELALRYSRLVINSPEPVTEELVFPLPGGGQVPVQAIRYAFRADGRWVIFTTLQDLTQRREAEQALKRLRVAVDRAADAVILVDPQDCSNLYFNQTAHTMLGYSADEYQALKPWEINTALESEAATRALYAELIALAPQVQIAAGSARRRDGGTVPMEYSRGAVELDGRWIVVVTGRDMTEQRQAEDELRQRMDDLTRSNQELERFAYVASHDLSEPLRMVASYTQLLERRYADRLDAEARGVIALAVDGARRMKRLIDDLLAYSRAGRADRATRDVAMPEVLRGALQDLAGPIEATGASVTHEGLPTVQGDPQALAQLVHHLLANALKFTHGRAPRVQVSAEAGPREWTFIVKDNGVGIEPLYYDRIFEVFQRLPGPQPADAAQAGQAQSGTGIGLAICKKIVERHGGRIWVESVPGQGSTFFFTLRREPAAAPAG